jgi:dTDP-glucose 4,6-dehydratase
MNLLVTGGAGFIGSNFVHYMVRKYPTYHIVSLDKLTYAGNLENLSDLRADSRHEFIKGDICDDAMIGRILRDHEIGAVVNFAAESHVDRSILGGREFVRSNVEGTLVLLELAKKISVKQFVQVSTDEVYGSLGSTGKFTESTPLHPNSPYSASKASADLLALAYQHTFGLPVVVTRCSNNYGPYQFPEKLIPLMILNALEDKPLPIYGDGLQVRDWLHVEDHCSAIDVALHAGVSGNVYNIGGSNEWKNLDLVKMLLKFLKKPERLISYVKDRPGHDRRYAIDSSKIQNELGWKATYSFEKGLQETVEWYRTHASWWKHILTGEYAQYYEQQYGHRSPPQQEAVS